MSTTKKALSLLLSVIMLLSLSAPVYAYAGTVTVAADNVTATQSATSQVVNLDLYMDYGTVEGFHIYHAISGGTGATLGEPSTTINGSFNGDETVAVLASGNDLTITASEGKYILYTLPVTIDANATGTWTVTFTIDELYDDDDDFTLASNTVTATITVSAASVTPTYQLYYTLDSNVDALTANYKDYAYNGTVTATVYLKASAAATLQAFDLFVTNDAKLTRGTIASDKGTLVTTGAGASTDTLTRIQMIGTAGQHSAYEVALPANTAVAIATIPYTIANTAVYDEDLAITITNASNIAIAETTESFTPTITSTDLGAEINTTYTVTFNKNCADTVEIPDPTAKQHGIDLSLSDPLPEPSRTGYTFLGYTETEGGTTAEYAKGTSSYKYTKNENKTLYAVWSQDSYDVNWHYNADDTSLTYTEDDAYHYGDTASYPAAGTTPVKVSTTDKVFTFIGWNTTAGATEALSPLTVTGDMDFYAVFSEAPRPYTITWVDGNGNTIYTEQVDYGTTPAYDSGTYGAPGKTATAQYTYNFTGWSPAVTAVTGDATYTAQFDSTTNQYAYSYALGDHAADGQTAPTGATVDYGTSITLPAGPTAAEGYTFSGWSDGTTTYGAGDGYTVTGEKTLTAQYTENTYTIVYNGNSNTGGTVPGNQSALYTGSVTIAANELTRTGYTAQGWNTAANGNGNDISGTVTMSTLVQYADSNKQITLYAKWGTEAYTISYDLAGGELASGVTNPTGYDITTADFTLNNPTRAGYTFAGWTGTGLSEATTTVTIAQGSTGNRSYVATWTEGYANFTVKYWQQNLNDTNNTSYTEMTADEETVTTGVTGQLTSTVFTPADGKYEGFHLSTVDGKNVAVTILADGSAVLNVYYDRNTYTVTYQYTGTVPDGAPAVPVDNNAYRYGAEYTVAANMTMIGYDFSGWTPATGAQTMGAGNVTVTGSWSAADNSYKVRHVRQALDGTYSDSAVAVDGVVEIETISEHSGVNVKTGDTTQAAARSYTGFTAGTVTQTTVAADGSTVVTIQYSRNMHKVTYSYTNTVSEMKSVPSDLPAEATSVMYGATVTVADAATANGYDFGGWKIEGSDAGATFVMGDADVAITGTFTAHEYTIIFAPNGGSDFAADATYFEKNKIHYTIESGTTLPSASGYLNHSFVNWKVTTADGNWAADSEYSAGTNIDGKYGNVTLTALWTESLRYAVEEYKYAPTGYRLLIVDASGAGDGEVYKYDGATMYYTTDSNYQITTTVGGVEATSTAVYYTLIAAASNALGAEQIAKIAPEAGTQATITYDGDINGDGIVNIADANAVYRMVELGGSYYSSLDMVSIAQRLAADMDKSTEGQTDEHRGSIADVNAIVTIIKDNTYSG